MGGKNSADIAQAVHEAVLKSYACTDPDNVLTYGLPLPVSNLLEGTYLDDHIVLHILDKCNLSLPKGADNDLLERSYEAYANAGLPRSKKKGFGFSQVASDGTPLENSCGLTDFAAWGTQIRSNPGTAAAPVDKRRHIAILAFSFLCLPCVAQTMLRRMVALLGHPLQHRRELTCTFHRIFKWCQNLSPKVFHKWPADVRDELLAAALTLPIAHSNLRWQVDTNLTATDATPTSFATVSCPVSRSLAEALLQFV